MILFYMSCKDLTDTYDTITQAITFVVIGIGLVLVFMSLVMARSFTKPFKDTRELHQQDFRMVSLMRK